MRADNKFLKARMTDEELEMVNGGNFFKNLWHSVKHKFQRFSACVKYAENKTVYAGDPYHKKVRSKIVKVLLWPM